MSGLFDDEELLRLENGNLFSDKPVTVLEKTFPNDDERRTYFREELRKKLPELKNLEGYPIGEDDDILNLSDPPYYTACPNPWLNDFVSEWENEKQNLEKEGKRKSNFEVNNPYSSDVTEGKNNAIYNAHTYHTKVPHPAIMRYILHYTQPGDIVYDGFGGTGMTGVASKMCGHADQDLKDTINTEFTENGYKKPIWGERNSICGDLSPIASFIAYNYNSKINVPLFKKKAQKLLDDIKNECGWMYKTKHVDGSQGIINYVVWADNYVCNNCGETINYYKATVTKNGKVATVTKKLKCEKCGSIFEHTDLKKKLITRFDSLTNETRQMVDTSPILINYSDSNGKGRFEKKLDDDDIKILDKIDNMQLKGWIPTDLLEKGVKTQEPINHHVLRINQFYQKRTAYVLSRIFDLIGEDKQLKFIFTSMLPKLTKMNRYMPQHGSRALVGPMANAFYTPPMCVENEPISQFEFQLGKIIKAFELTNLSVININSATDKVINDNSIDYIFVDPPFGANIMYSELNCISESWLRVKTNNHDEAIENDCQKKGLPEYMHLMSKSFKNFYAYLKPGKWMTVEFSNTSNAVWNGIRNAINQAGFVITSIGAIDKERPGLQGMTTTTAVNEDLILQCYKPSEMFINNLKNRDGISNVWDFVTDYLEHLSLPMVKEEKSFAVAERNPKILYDKVITYFLMANIPLPIDALDFQDGLSKRYVQEDGMVFTQAQLTEYQNLKIKHRIDTAQGFLNFDLIDDERSAITWLNYRLQNNPQTYQEIQPDYRKAYSIVKKGELQIELKDVLEENFIKNEDETWRVPDFNEAKDREILRTKALLKTWENYCTQIETGKVKKLKDVRLEAIKAGFKDSYQKKNFKRIVSIGDKIPENLLTEDETLLNYYDIASSKI